MNLDMLAGNTVEEKKEPEIVKVEYDKTKANLEQPGFSSTKELPYVKRAVEYIKLFGFELVDNLKLALEGRANKLKVLTIHEADVAYRGNIDLNNRMIETSLYSMLGFLSEELNDFSEDVFILRARWNKGLEWKRLKRHLASPESQAVGDKTLESIKNQIQDLGLKIHPEEELNGFEREFLKPEYLDWNSFNQVMHSKAKNK